MGGWKDARIGGKDLGTILTACIVRAGLRVRHCGRGLRLGRVVLDRLCVWLLGVGLCSAGSVLCRWRLRSLPG